MIYYVNCVDKEWYLNNSFPLSSVSILIRTNIYAVYGWILLCEDIMFNMGRVYCTEMQLVCIVLWRNAILCQLLIGVVYNFIKVLFVKTRAYDLVINSIIIFDKV